MVLNRLFFKHRVAIDNVENQFLLVVRVGLRRSVTKWRCYDGIVRREAQLGERFGRFRVSTACFRAFKDGENLIFTVLGVEVDQVVRSKLV